MAKGKDRTKKAANARAAASGATSGKRPSKPQPKASPKPEPARAPKPAPKPATNATSKPASKPATKTTAQAPTKPAAKPTAGKPAQPAGKSVAKAVAAKPVASKPVRPAAPAPAPVAPAPIKPAKTVEAPAAFRRDYKKWLERLLSLRQQLVIDGERLGEEGLKALEQEVSVDHMADYGSDSYEQDTTLALIENKSEALRDVDEAIRRMDAKTYGLCEECESMIPIGRLEVLPHARYCVKCQSARESAA